MIHVLVTAFFIGLSGWAVYQTACFLADGIGVWGEQRQKQFNATLLEFLFIFSIGTIVVGSTIHFHLIKRVTDPLRRLIDSVKQMKDGRYPDPLSYQTNDEIGQLNGHFNDLVRQLKKSELEKREMVADLSHEFRTPLSNLNGYLAALKNGVIEADVSMYEALHQESQRLTEMLEQLERLKAWDGENSSVKDKKVVDLSQILAQSSALFRFAIEEKGINLTTDLHPGKVFVNQAGIQQVMTNLLENAVRYHEGSGSIHIDMKDREAHYEVAVTGRGEAIPEEAKGRIFERFYRVDPSRQKETGGTGLGLAISKEIVEHHGGAIGLETNGSVHRFWFTIPK